MLAAVPIEVTVYGFETSNNTKVRVALGYKGIPYRFHSIDRTDRGKIVELSGQRLTPVLVHGDVVLCDSAAIMRYLDCNFADTPTLCGRDHAQQWEIEDWELFARAVLAGPMMKIVHARVTGSELDDGTLARCAADFAAAVAKLTTRLDGRDWLGRDLNTRLIGADNRHPGAGFLEPSLSPVPIANASAGLQNTKLPKYLPPELFTRRLALANEFDKAFQTLQTPLIGGADARQAMLRVHEVSRMARLERGSVAQHQPDPEVVVLKCRYRTIVPSTPIGSRYAMPMRWQLRTRT